MKCFKREYCGLVWVAKLQRRETALISRGSLVLSDCFWTVIKSNRLCFGLAKYFLWSELYILGICVFCYIYMIQK